MASLAGHFFMENSSCYKKAIDLLAQRDHTKIELLRKLKRYDFDHDEITNVLEVLQERGYINHEAYTRIAVRSYSGKNYSMRKIQEKLSHNGINATSNEICEIMENEGVDYQQLVDQNTRKVIRSLQNKNLSSFELENKVLSRLYSRGFAIDEIKKSFRRCINESDISN